MKELSCLWKLVSCWTPTSTGSVKEHETSSSPRLKICWGGFALYNAGKTYTTSGCQTFTSLQDQPLHGNHYMATIFAIKSVHAQKASTFQTSYFVLLRKWGGTSSAMRFQCNVLTFIYILKCPNCWRMFYQWMLFCVCVCEIYFVLKGRTNYISFNGVVTGPGDFFPFRTKSNQWQNWRDGRKPNFNQFFFFFPSFPLASSNELGPRLWRLLIKLMLVLLSTTQTRHPFGLMEAHQ